MAEATMLTRTDAMRSVGEASPNIAEFSKMGWGGARANSGGARPGAGRKPKIAPIIIAPLGPRWYVIETHPSAERQVAYELARQGWRGYLPLTAVRRRDRVLPTMMHTEHVPLFRGIVFVEIDRDGKTWGTILSQIPGVRGIIKGAGGLISPVQPADFIAKLMTMDAERLNLTSVANPPRKVGERVTIGAGSLASFQGMVMACDGLTTTVNVEMFGRLVAVEVAWGHVEIAA